MALLKRMNWGATLRTSALRRALDVRTRSRTDAPSIVSRYRIEPRLLEEIGDWLLLAGVSLVGWLAAAIAFGII
jgi:hypothetical protein